jgi:hypothetical protein
VEGDGKDSFKNIKATLPDDANSTMVWSKVMTA